MRLLAAPLLLALAASPYVVNPNIADDALPWPSITIRFTMPGPNAEALAGQNGYYRPVQPQPYQRPCGTVATDVCEVLVTIPPGATGEQVYQMARQAEANHRKGEAISYLKKSAEMGYVTAQGALGTGYINGQEVPRDGRQGVYWLQKATNQGNRGAEVELAIVYEDGLGVPEDRGKAIEYLKAAAAQHQSLAEHRLGLDYEIARGVPHDRALAITWLRRAAADGAPVAGDTATALAHAKTAQFHSIEDIDDYMNPPPPAQKASGCPTLNHLISGTAEMARQYLFCQCHPGCPTTWDQGGPRCPMQEPHCIY